MTKSQSSEAKDYSSLALFSLLHVHNSKFGESQEFQLFRILLNGLDTALSILQVSMEHLLYLTSLSVLLINSKQTIFCLMTVYCARFFTASVLFAIGEVVELELYASVAF